MRTENWSSEKVRTHTRAAALLVLIALPGSSAVAEGGRAPDLTEFSIIPEIEGWGPHGVQGEKLWQAGETTRALEAFRAELATIPQDGTTESLSKAASLHVMTAAALATQQNFAASLREAELALSKYEAVSDQVTSSPFLEFRIPLVRGLLSGTLHEQGETTKALALQRQVIAELEARRERSPSVSHWNELLSLIHSQVAEALEESDPQAAIAALQASLEAHNRVPVPEDDASVHVWTKGTREWKLTLLLEKTGQTTSALEHGSASAEAAGKLSGLHPEQPEYRLHEGRTLSYLAGMYAENGNYPQALEVLAKALEAARSLPESQADKHELLAELYQKAQEDYAVLRRWDEAADAATSAVATRRRLVALQPGDPQRASDLGYAFQGAADCYDRAGRLADAMAASQAAVAAARYVDRASTDAGELLGFLTYNTGRLRDFHEATGTLKDAVEWARRSVEHAQRWASLAAGDCDSRLAYLDAELSLASLENYLGETAGAIKRCTRVLELAGEAQSACSTGTPLLLWDASLIQCDLLTIGGRPAEALEHGRRALKIAKETVAGDPSPENELQVMWAMSILGETEAILPSTRELALRSLRGAMNRADKLLAEDPHSWHCQMGAASTSLMLGRVLSQTGSPDGNAALERALRLARSGAYSQTNSAKEAEATALFLLNRGNEARPVAGKLLERGMRYPPFLELCRKHGMPVPPDC